MEIWQSLLDQCMLLIVTGSVVGGVLRVASRTLRPALDGNVYPALPRFMDRTTSSSAVGRKTILLWLLAVLLVRAAQYGLSAVYFYRAVEGGQYAPAQMMRYFWTQWDAPHYIKLAEQWYVNEGNDRLMLVFFPMYPMLIRILAMIGIPEFWGALSVSLASTMGCVVALQWLLAPKYGRRVAHLACAYLLVNPFAVFLAAPYPEALFLCLTLFTLYFASKRRYILAGVLGALSAYTRLLGLVVLGAILLEGYTAALTRHGRQWWRARDFHRAVLGAAIVLLGFAAYLLLNVRISGHPFTFLEYQRSNWSQSFGSLWNTSQTTVRTLFQDIGTSSFWGTWLPQLLTIAWVLLLLLFRGRRLSLTHEAFSWVYLYLALSPTWLLSGSRYVMAMATLPLLQAVAVRRKWPHVVSISVQAVLQVIVLWMYGIARNVL